MALPARTAMSEHHGHGWRGLQRMANYLEAHPDERHIVFCVDPFTGEQEECEVHGRAEVRLMVRHLRKQIEVMRDRERAGLN